jgi:hypothetical protein
MFPGEAGWDVLGVSVVGAGHVRGGQVCQDAHRWRCLPGGVLVVAVADGAGSVPQAEVGSVRAVEVAITTGADRLGDPARLAPDGWAALLTDVFRTARQAVEQEAAARCEPPGNLASTLLLVFVTPTTIAAGQIGDGAIVARFGENDWRAITRPPATEYCNETTFLTSGPALPALQTVVQTGEVTGLAVFSDGLQMLALRMPQGEPHVPFFAPLLRFVTRVDDPARGEARLREFLQSPRVVQRTDDDLTLVLAARTAGKGCP